MAKDRTGKFHPGKGKPSGINKEEGLGLHSTEPDKLEEYLEITDKYTEGADELSANVRLRHPNRNTSKGEAQYKDKENKEVSNKTENISSEDYTPVVAEELPGVLTKEIFSELATYRDERCISVFLGTHRAGVEVNEQIDPLLFKNVLQDVTTKLSQKGMNKPSIEKLLDPVKELISNDEFWKQQSDGLALFIADGFFKYIRLTMTPTEEIIIENSFYVTPLIPVMTNKEFFYLLVISKKQVKLFKADAFGMQYLPVEGLLQDMDDVQAEDEETTLHTANRTATGGPNFYEISGINTVNSKANIATYLEAADDIIWKKILHNETVPLLIAGVEYLIPIYKSVTNYKHVWEDALTGSHEHEDITTLYQQAKQKMQPYFEQRVKKAMQLFGNQSATEFTSSIPSDVIPCTYYARVSHLFVQNGVHIWGTFDEMNNELKFHEKQEAESEDLIDNAVVKTLATGGEVFLLEKEKMPAESTMAAILRY